MSHINIQEGSKMNIIVHEESKQFHLCNDYISYVMYVQPNGELGQLYFGKKIHDREDFSHLVNCCLMAVTPYYDESTFFSLEKNRQEYPSFGTGDFGTPAFKIIDQNGSGVSCFKYVTYSISRGCGSAGAAGYRGRQCGGQDHHGHWRRPDRRSGPGCKSSSALGFPGRFC